MHPDNYSRRVLLAVTGLSPQVVTETLYALAVQRSPAFVPSEIHLITTAEGSERARLSLLHEKSGWFHKLRSEYELPSIQFDQDQIHVLRGVDDQPLNDIRSPNDNIAAADFISELVRQFTCDEACALHVSVAGGRKTMGLYLGYALSLFGREQDRLSHVLVSAPYESHPQFFYPTRDSQIIYTPPPDNRPYDTRDARITLAEIPFVRLRNGLDDALVSGDCSFHHAVEQAQRILPPLRLELHPNRCELVAAGEKIALKPAWFALYWLLAERALRLQPGVYWSDPGLEQELLGYYGRLVGTHSGEYERAECTYGRGLTKEHIDPVKSHIKRLLVRELGKRLAEPYLIKPLEPIAGSRYRRFGLDLPAGAIQIHSGKLAVNANRSESARQSVEVQAGKQRREGGV